MKRSCKELESKVGALLEQQVVAIWFEGQLMDQFIFLIERFFQIFLAFSENINFVLQSEKELIQKFIMIFEQTTCTFQFVFST